MNKVKSRIPRILLTIALIILALIFIGGAVSSIISKIYIRNVLSNIQDQQINVATIKASPRSWQSYYQASGSIRAEGTSNVISLTSGKVDNVLIKSGAQVKKGDLLIELNSKAEINLLKSQEHKLKLAYSNYINYQKLYKEGAVSKFDLDQVTTEYLSLKANIEATKENINNKNIVAPISGTVGSISVVTGDFIQAGMNILSVTNKDNNIYRVDFSLPADKAKQLHYNSKVMASLSTHDGYDISGIITAIDNNVDSITGGINIQAILNTNTNKLTNGEFVALNIYTDPQENSIVIPDIAIFYNLYGTIAYKVEPLNEDDALQVLQYLTGLPDEQKLNIINNMGRAKYTIIDIAERSDNYALIKSGIKPGDVIITNATQIKDGSLVNISPNLGISVDKSYQVGFLGKTFKELPKAKTQNKDKK